jgi:hypothetical protein
MLYETKNKKDIEEKARDNSGTRRRHLRGPTLKWAKAGCLAKASCLIFHLGYCKFACEHIQKSSFLNAILDKNLMTLKYRENSPNITNTKNNTRTRAPREK